ncbi:MAG TPA: enoyl-CoA hydratase [Alphaproteobacteria bacterium]|nr:enoyl-CoA hydratase [Alphaproteobacteria bacterium]
MTSAKITARHDGAIGWLVIDNPERRNAVTYEMWAAIPEALEGFARDFAIRAIVVTGSGEEAFASGADISEFAERRATPEAVAHYNATTTHAHAALIEIAKPTIAMIHGFCIGGGLALALCCDIRMAAEGSRFGVPAARLGLGYRYDGVKRLVDLVGPAYAREIFFTARRFDAKEALQMGLVNAVLPKEALEAAVKETVDTIAANAPLTIAAAKLAIEEALKDPAERDLASVDEAVEACFKSQDYIEGRQAFVEKRRPKFRGV